MNLPRDVAVGRNMNWPVVGSRTSWKPTGGIGIGTIDSTGSDALSEKSLNYRNSFTILKKTEL